MNIKIRASNFPQALTEVRNAIEQVKGKLHSDKTYQSDLISTAEAAELLNLSIATIHSKARRRQILFYKKGEKLLFSRKELDVWAKAGVKVSNRKPRESISLRELKIR